MCVELIQHLEVDSVVVLDEQNDHRFETNENHELKWLAFLLATDLVVDVYSRQIALNIVRPLLDRLSCSCLILGANHKHDLLLSAICEICRCTNWINTSKVGKVSVLFAVIWESCQKVIVDIDEAFFLFGLLGFHEKLGFVSGGFRALQVVSNVAYTVQLALVFVGVDFEVGRLNGLAKAQVAFDHCAWTAGRPNEVSIKRLNVKMRNRGTNEVVLVEDCAVLDGVFKVHQKTILNELSLQKALFVKRTVVKSWKA